MSLFHLMAELRTEDIIFLCQSQKNGAGKVPTKDGDKHEKQKAGMLRGQVEHTSIQPQSAAENSS